MNQTGYGTRATKLSARVFALELEVVDSLLREFDTPRSLTVHLLIHSGEWKQLLGLTVDPRNYLETQVDKFRLDIQATKILQKNPRLPTGISTVGEAVRKFYDAESQCVETNRRIQQYLSGDISLPPDITSVLHSARQVIKGIIGPRPGRDDLEFAYENMRFGPGATTSVSGIVSQGKKYSNLTLDCTEDLVSFRTHCFPPLWRRWVSPDINIVRGSRFATVPKDAKTDRGICIEPDLNIYVQLGFGALLRKKLRKHGLDLNTQEPNQELSRVAWKEDLCTMDLSSASDTVSIETVKLLLPEHWWETLAWCRSPNTLIEGNWVELAKWSSMGNGYTFELESLIFYGLAIAATPVERRQFVRVFGDDIIIPNEASSLLTRTLNFLGFSVNTEKTFGKGLFHESCGTDWFCGVNVRPFFLRSQHHDFTTICYIYANSISRWSSRSSCGWARDARCLPSWLRCYTAVEPKDRHHIPDGVGDVGFCSDFDRAVPELVRRHNRRTGWMGYWYRYRYIGPSIATVSVLGSYLASLSGICNTSSTSFSYGEEALRGRYSRAATKTGYVHKWPVIGPWR